jgi:hypothetical protein
MVCINIFQETSKLELSLHVRVGFVSKTYTERTRISRLIGHTEFVVQVSIVACNITLDMQCHMTLKCKSHCFLWVLHYPDNIRSSIFLHISNVSIGYKTSGKTKWPLLVAFPLS